MTTDQKINEAIEAAKPTEIEKLETETEKLEMKIEKHESAIAKLDAKKDKILAKTPIKCVRNNYDDGCGKEFPIKDITYIQTHWYIEPHGCTGGDYWRQGEGNWSCPECGHRNRIVDCWTEGIEDRIDPLKNLFKGVEDEHKER